MAQQVDRRALRDALAEVAPWTRETDVGPRAVDAGQCDRCGEHPRLLPTCGPVAWRALCRDCALVVDTDAWCDGHRSDGERWLEWARSLPAWWGDAVVLSWVAAGEVGFDAEAVHHARLPSAVRGALPEGRGGTSRSH